MCMPSITYNDVPTPAHSVVLYSVYYSCYTVRTNLTLRAHFFSCPSIIAFVLGALRDYLHATVAVHAAAGGTRNPFAFIIYTYDYVYFNIFYNIVPVEPVPQTLIRYLNAQDNRNGVSSRCYDSRNNGDSDQHVIFE